MMATYEKEYDNLTCPHCGDVYPFAFVTGVTKLGSVATQCTWCKGKVWIRSTEHGGHPFWVIDEQQHPAQPAGEEVEKAESICEECGGTHDVRPFTEREQQTLKAHAAIAEDLSAKVGKHGRYAPETLAGEIACPICGSGRLRWHRSPTCPDVNRVSATCSTKGCMFWIM